MEETIKRINELLKYFNSTFDISPTIENDEVTGLKINSLKNDGSEFTNNFFNLFGEIIKQDSNFELIYDETRGLSIVKKVVKQVEQVDYEFQD